MNDLNEFERTIYKYIEGLYNAILDYYEEKNDKKKIDRIKLYYENNKEKIKEQVKRSIDCLRENGYEDLNDKQKAEAIFKCQQTKKTINYFAVALALAINYYPLSVSGFVLERYFRGFIKHAIFKK